MLMVQPWGGLPDSAQRQLYQLELEPLGIHHVAVCFRLHNGSRKRMAIGSKTRWSRTRVWPS